MIPLPPLAEQERIVAKLDAAFAEIDTGIEAANAKVMEVDCFFKKELENIFSNGEFKSVNLEELAKVTSSKRVLKSNYVESGIPFYRTKEVKELANGKPIRTELFISQEQFNEFKNKSGAPKSGDVLITAIGTIGEVYVVQQDDEFYFKDGNILWLRNISGLNSYYLRYSLINFVDELNRLAHGAAYSALPIQRLKSHKIPIKSLSEQSSSVLKLDTLGKLIQDIGELNNNKISALKALKSAILTQELQSSEAA
jgi:type I restriction enzyme S subunit